MAIYQYLFISNICLPRVIFPRLLGGMRNKIRLLWANQLFRGTSVFFFGNLVVSGFAFLYHWIMPRLLGPAEFGNLAAIFGLIYVVGIPMNALDFLVTKLVAGFEEDDVWTHCRSLLEFILSKLGWFVALSIPVAWVLGQAIQNFLKLPDLWVIWAIWLLAVISFVITIARAILKGLLKYADLLGNQIAEIFLRLIFAVAMVLMISAWYGWGLWGIVLATIVALLISVYQLRTIWSVKSIPFAHHKWPLKSLGTSSLLLSISYTLMYSIDILLVKHFFDSFHAGIYAVLATAGKIVYFAQSPLVAALVPVVARKTKNPTSARSDLLILTGVTFGVSVAIVFGYWLFGESILINLIFTRKFIEALPLLVPMGLALAAYSFANLAANFLLALDQSWAAWVSLIALVAQIAGIILFHQNLTQVVTTLLTVFAILATILIIACLYVTRSQKIIVVGSDAGV